MAWPARETSRILHAVSPFFLPELVQRVWSLDFQLFLADISFFFCISHISCFHSGKTHTTGVTVAGTRVGALGTGPMVPG